MRDASNSRSTPLAKRLRKVKDYILKSDCVDKIGQLRTLIDAEELLHYDRTRIWSRLVRDAWNDLYTCKVGEHSMKSLDLMSLYVHEDGTPSTLSRHEFWKSLDRHTTWDEHVAVTLSQDKIYDVRPNAYGYVYYQWGTKEKVVPTLRPPQPQRASGIVSLLKRDNSDQFVLEVAERYAACRKGLFSETCAPHTVLAKEWTVDKSHHGLIRNTATREKRTCDSDWHTLANGTHVCLGYDHSILIPYDPCIACELKQEHAGKFWKGLSSWEGVRVANVSAAIVLLYAKGTRMEGLQLQIQNFVATSQVVETMCFLHARQRGYVVTCGFKSEEKDSNRRFEEMGNTRSILEKVLGGRRFLFSESHDYEYMVKVTVDTQRDAQTVQALLQTIPGATISDVPPVPLADGGVVLEAFVVPKTIPKSKDLAFARACFAAYPDMLCMRPSRSHKQYFLSTLEDFRAFSGSMDMSSMSAITSHVVFTILIVARLGDDLATFCLECLHNCINCLFDSFDKEVVASALDASTSVVADEASSWGDQIFRFASEKASDAQDAIEDAARDATRATVHAGIDLAESASAKLGEVSANVATVTANTASGWLHQWLPWLPDANFVDGEELLDFVMTYVLSPAAILQAPFKIGQILRRVWFRYERDVYRRLTRWTETHLEFLATLMHIRRKPPLTFYEIDERRRAYAKYENMSIRMVYNPKRTCTAHGLRNCDRGCNELLTRNEVERKVNRMLETS